MSSFNLEAAITRWKGRLGLRDGIADEDRDEMESHLRDEIEAFVTSGLSAKAAFYRAAGEFGNEDELSARFKDANWEKESIRKTTRAPLFVCTHLKFALRSAGKQKGYTAINLVGLAVGLACCTLILLFVRDELSYDRFHRDSDRIYRVAVDRINAGVTELRVQTPDGLAAELHGQIPDIEQLTWFVPTSWGRHTLKVGQNQIVSDQGLAVQNSFFRVFSLEFLEGDSERPISGPESIVLTESLARKLFGDTSALGRTLSFDGSNMVTVAAVIADVPDQSHFHFDYLLALPPDMGGCLEASCGRVYAYVKLRQNASREQTEKKIQQLAQANQALPIKDRYFLQPLAGLHGLHLRSHRAHELQPNGHINYLKILSGLAFFIVVIAGINYVNLATARSSLRSKEIGVRKVVGVQKEILIWQFLLESVCTVGIAGLLAIGLCHVALPSFNHFVGKNLSLFESANIPVWSILGVLVLVLGIAAGFYPAIYLSRFKPVPVLTHRHEFGKSGFGFRRWLVVFQFTVASLLIICSLVIQRQLDFVDAADLGFAKKDIVVVTNFYKISQGNLAETAKSAIASVLGVSSVGSTTDIVGFGDTAWGSIRVQGSDRDILVSAAHVDDNYLQTVGIDIVEGRYFSDVLETSGQPLSAILNQTAVDQLGLKKPAVGQQITDEAGRTSRIVGVVKDFNYLSLHDQIGPYVFFWHDGSGVLAVRTDGRDTKATLTQIELIWSRFVPDVAMEYYMLDNLINRHYEAERNFRTLFSIAMTLGLLIACLGMFGLVAFTTERRTKEIGIRKVLGGSVGNMLSLLSKDFLLLVLAASLIAWPIGIWAMTAWLARFAYRVDIGITTLLAAAGLSMIVASATVFWHVHRAATMNPVDSLRYE